MKAAVFRRYGPPDVVEIVDCPSPVATKGRVLVRVIASSVNPVDWHRLRGEPFLVRMTEGLRRPKDGRLGADLAGIVEAVGSGVTAVAPGDEVFGMTIGTFAELVAVKAEGLIRKPMTVSFEEAGSTPVAALTALQGLSKRARVTAGQHVLVSGAGGGVGHFAVQIAKALGARVTAATSGDRLELVRSLGADEVLDYATVDPTAGDLRYDTIFDAGGSLSLRQIRRGLRRGGVAVLAGAGSRNLLGLVGRVVGAQVLTRLDDRRYVSYVARRTADDLETLRSMLEQGQIRSHIDRRYALADVAEAIRYQETGRACGKVVLTVGEVGGPVRLDE